MEWKFDLARSRRHGRIGSGNSYSSNFRSRRPWRYASFLATPEAIRRTGGLKNRSSTANRHFSYKFGTKIPKFDPKNITGRTWSTPWGPSPTFRRARSPRGPWRSRPLFFWANQKTERKRGAKFGGELRPRSWDTEAGLDCASSCAQPVEKEDPISSGNFWSGAL